MCLPILIALLAAVASALANSEGHSTPFDSNLVFRSPWLENPQLDVDTRSLYKRHIGNGKRKRQTVPAGSFSDGHYPTFFGGDFSNALFVWSGGLNFTHNVASGDPFDTSVLLWTRAVPTPTNVDLDSNPVCVSWVISTSPTLSHPVDKGEAFSSYDVDFTVKVEATGLKADTSYFYQFSDCTNAGTKSPVGTTRTISSPNTPASQVNGGKPLTIAVFSCSQFQNGWFNAYDFAAHNTTADIFVHLGDYYYESLGNGASIGRKVLGRELATVADYRQRLNQYRTDQGLIAAHNKAPWITVWDDHEVADQSWKAGTANSNDSTIGCSFSPSGACFSDRKLAGVRAYHEWIPIRQVATDDKLRIWRNFQIGKLLDLTMLDTRQYDRDITDVYYNTQYINSIADAQNRSIMGFPQENWFYSTLSQSKARGAIWRIVGQQIVFTMLNESGALDVDAWDGYRANRARVLQHIKTNDISNTVILSGDSHANWVSDLAFPLNDTSTYDPVTGKGALGVEFAGTAVTSGSPFGNGISPQAADNVSRVLVDVNTDLQWSEASFRGFFTLKISTKEIQAQYYAMRNTSFSNRDGFGSALFTVQAGANKLQRPVAGGNVTAGVLKSQVVNGTA